MNWLCPFRLDHSKHFLHHCSRHIRTLDHYFAPGIHRFHPVAPIGFPHSNPEDRRYGQYEIPKDSTIFVNWWKLSHDPELFDNPDVFDTEGYMKHPLGLGAVKQNEYEEIEASGKDNLLKMEGTNGLMWGTGRKKCPGMYLAATTMELTTMNILWGFNFSKSKDSSGRTVEPDITKYKPGIVSMPELFECDIEVRSARHESIICRDYHDSAAAFEPTEQELTDEDQIWARTTRVEQDTTLED